MTRLVVFNCKGGVGKTTTTMNLAAALARSGGAVTMMDLDPQSHLTRILGALPKDPKESLFGFYANALPLNSLKVDWPNIGWLMPSHGQLMKVDSLFGKGPSALLRLKQGLDTYDTVEKRTVLIDCCPYVGVLSLNSIFAADFLLVPVSTDYLSMQGAQQIERTLAALEPVLKRRVPRRYLLTRFDRRRRLSDEIRRIMTENYGDELCETVITESVSLAESPSVGMDVFSHQPDSRGAADYQLLFEELRSAGLV